MSDPVIDDDDSGNIWYALAYKIKGTKLQVWHLIVGALVIGFAAGKLI